MQIALAIIVGAKAFAWLGQGPSHSWDVGLTTDAKATVFPLRGTHHWQQPPWGVHVRKLNISTSVSLVDVVHARRQNHPIQSVETRRKGPIGFHAYQILVRTFTTSLVPSYMRLGRCRSDRNHSPPCPLDVLNAGSDRTFFAASNNTEESDRIMDRLPFAFSSVPGTLR